MPKPKYYDALSGSFVDVSDQFVEQLKSMAVTAKTAAVTWINTAGSEKSTRAVKEGLLEAEMIAFETKSLASLAIESKANLGLYQLFRLAFIGVPSSPELGAFLDSSSFGVEDMQHYQEQLDYRQHMLDMWTLDAASRAAQVSGMGNQLKSFGPLFTLG